MNGILSELKDIFQRERGISNVYSFSQGHIHLLPTINHFPICIGAYLVST